MRWMTEKTCPPRPPSRFPAWHAAVVRPLPGGSALAWEKPKSRPVLYLRSGSLGTVGTSPPPRSDRRRFASRRFCIARQSSIHLGWRVDELGRRCDLQLDDLLDLLVNLLTLIAIAMVALEKARPEQDQDRRTWLRNFVRYSVIASPRLLQRRAAMAIARALKATRVVGGLVGYAGAPLSHLMKDSDLKKWPFICAHAVLLWYAFKTDSVWLWRILPGLIFALILVLASYPAFYVLWRGNELGDAADAGNVLRKGTRFYAIVDEPRLAHRRVLRVLSFVHPTVRRGSKKVGVGVAGVLRDFIPAALAGPFLMPLPIALIDGFIASPWPVRIAVLATGIAPLLLTFMVPLFLPLYLFQQRFTHQTVRQIAWSGTHGLRAMGPSAVIAAITSLTYASLAPTLHASGGGWFVFVHIAFDTMLAAATGSLLRDVIRTRASASSTLTALIWVSSLILVVAGLKLYVSMLSAAQPLGLIDAFKIAINFDLDSNPDIGLFLVAQTATLYWTFYVPSAFVHAVAQPVCSPYRANVWSCSRYGRTARDFGILSYGFGRTGYVREVGCEGRWVSLLRPRLSL